MAGDEKGSPSRWADCFDESTRRLFAETWTRVVSAERAVDDPLPESIGRYRVLEKLGRGGMGDVFLAWDDALGRRIALKRIRRDRVSRAEVRRRFEIEARVTGMLQHPSIVPVYEFLPVGDETYYTMRPIEGITLEKLIGELGKDRPGLRAEWPTARLVRLFLQAANAIAFAHSRDVIHRDLKPSNIMIGPFEQVLVLDWGMAKVLGEEKDDGREPSPMEPLGELTANTASRYLVGTPAYMAPEQLRNEPATFRSDIFSLGIILYELLALRYPWEAATLSELAAAMGGTPEIPTRVQPGRNIPHELARVVLRALEYHPGGRFATVGAFSRETAHALEGRASWNLDGSSRDRGNWRLASGRLAEESGAVVLRSRGPGLLFRYFCMRRFTDDLRVEFEFSFRRRPHELSVWLNATHPGGEAMDESGYRLLVIPGRGRTLSLSRSGRVVAGAKSPAYKPRQWYRATVVREDDRFSLLVDGEEIYVYHDPIPLTGGFPGITGRADGLLFRDLSVYSRGASATVSCLSVPDAFFNRRLYEEARSEYERIVASHPGRSEGRLAGFRAGLCLVEMAREEDDLELRSMLLNDACDAFRELEVNEETCLGALGQAMVAGMRSDAAGKYDALRRALEHHSGDTHLSTVREWLLAKLHAAGVDQRRTLAELLPLALSHCVGDWGRRVVRELVKDTRRSWETPSFMTSRGRFKENDAVTHGEARLFFAFWAARPEIIEETTAELVAGRMLRPHHLADAVLSLLELGHRQRARRLLDEVEHALRGPMEARSERMRALCRTAVMASCGDLEVARHHFASVDSGAVDRVYNSARLWLARALFDADKPFDALKILRPESARDGFAREQQAWFYLRLGDARRAARQLKPFLDSNDHRSGRNLANFLHGTSLIVEGREDEAMQVFSFLEPVPWPRTWTLGSHYALGRLGGGRLESYVARSFPWERRILSRQAALLARARGETIDSLPEELLETLS